MSGSTRNRPAALAVPFISSFSSFNTDSLASYFSRFGEVKYAEVSFVSPVSTLAVLCVYVCVHSRLQDEKTGVSRLFGKVRMSSDEELQSILDTDQHKIEGSVVSVAISPPPCSTI